MSSKSQAEQSFTPPDPIDEGFLDYTRDISNAAQLCIDRRLAEVTEVVERAAYLRTNDLLNLRRIVALYAMIRIPYVYADPDGRKPSRKNELHWLLSSAATSRERSGIYWSYIRNTMRIPESLISEVVAQYDQNLTEAQLFAARRSEERAKIRERFDKIGGKL